MPAANRSRTNVVGYGICGAVSAKLAVLCDVRCLERRPLLTLVICLFLRAGPLLYGDSQLDKQSARQRRPPEGRSLVST